MSEIVIDLQKDALSPNTDILSLLRKSYLIARKLNLTEFEKWINFELNGYPNDKNIIPDYRIVSGEIKAWNPMHGWIPTMLEDSELEKALTEHRLNDSLANLLNLFEGETAHFQLNFNSSLNNKLSSLGTFSTKFAVHVGKNQLYQIFEVVKTNILDWAITLEENGILGDNLVFTAKEKDNAKSPTINNYTNNFYGDSSNIQIQQDTDNSIQE